MTGLMRLGELAHVLEARVVDMGAQARPAEKEFEEAEDRIDRFSVALERLSRGEDVQDIVPVEVPVSAVFEQQKDKPTPLAVIAAAAETMAQQQGLPPELREVRAALLRVNADLVDQFVNEAGELSIARSRIEGEMAAFRRALSDLAENVSRMRVQLREIEIASEGQMQSRLKEQEEHGANFDPLEFDRFTRMQELTRFLAESLGDVITLQQGLQKNIDETELAILQQARLNRELQQGLMGVRLVPLGNLADRFYRVVRQTAKDVNRKANLELKGIRVELDRSVLEKITAPFEHLLRNAVAHGIETPQERVAAGKPEIGEIVIDAVQRGNEVVLTVADDGRGLDLAGIRERAVEMGMMGPGDELPGEALAQFIFWPGFTTAKEVTQVAGRGVGMDVVKSEITSLGGRVELSTQPGRGTTFTISLPLTLAVTQAVMLRAGDRLFAVPSVMIDQVQEYKGPSYAESVCAGRGAVEGQPLPAAFAHDAPGRTRHPGSPAADSRAAAQERPAARRDPGRRDHRQPRNRGEDHRPAARPPRRHRRRHGAGQRPGRAHPEPGEPDLRRGRGRDRQGPGNGAAGAGAGGPQGGAARDGGRRLAHGAQDHQPDARARGLRVRHGEGRRGRAAAAPGRAPRRDPPRRRDAAHGRVRVRAQRPRRRGHPAHPDHHDHLAHGRQAPRPAPSSSA